MAKTSWILHPKLTPPVLVACGGFAGAALRASLDIAAKTWPNLPFELPFGLAWSTWLVNILGAFLLGLLASWTGLVVARANAQDGANASDSQDAESEVASARLKAQIWTNRKVLLGTGFMGAFTTYGTWATGAVSGFSYGLGNILAITVVMLALGLVAAGVGHFVAKHLFNLLS